MKYSGKIEGLRGLAVIAVIIYHAAHQLLPGGYLGVDIFFVISGYLMSKIIYEQITNNEFSFTKFYIKRARRLLPTLYVVLFFTYLGGWRFLVPSEFKELSQSLFATLILMSNYFFMVKSGYFDVSVDLKPLLHTWSLGVEEQFYLLFPISMYYFGKNKNYSKAIFIAICLSFVLSLIVANKYPNINFYSLATRIWQLLFGALLGLFSLKGAEYVNKLNNNSKRIKNTLSVVAMSILIGSLVLINNTKQIPGWLSLFPILSCGYIILCVDDHSVAGRLLNLSVIRFFGKISYSAYLWHQPVFAYFRQYYGDSKNLDIAVLSMIIILILSYLSWKYIESPFRNDAIVSEKRFKFQLILMSVLLMSLAIWGILSDGIPNRINLPKSVAQSFSRTSRLNECADKLHAHKREDWFCSLGVKGKPEFMVIGDSHALSLLDVYDEIAKEDNYNGILVSNSGCPPLLGIYALRSDQDHVNCHDINERIYKFAYENKIKEVILVGRWSYYTDGGYDGSDVSYLGIQNNSDKNIINSRIAFQYGVNETQKRYGAIGVKPYVIEQIPEQKYLPGFVFQRTSIADQNDVNFTLENYSTLMSNHIKLQEFTRREFNKYSTYNVISLDKIYCNSKYCPIGVKDKSYYFDKNHLSVAGAELAKKELKMSRKIN